jgi:pimeloyl-ACP methyl ester carboxylesterase
VLLVHGISTPCLSLGAVADGLVAKGCRVMLFDLWGRGYSDSCSDLKHDDRLYATEILLAVTSSSLSWTGGPNGGFSIIGYSLGGGIAASFTSFFPEMIKSLVLLAPSGIIRPEHMSFRSRFLYSVGIVPEAFLQWLVWKTLKDGSKPRKASGPKIDAGDALTAEMQSNDSNPLYNNSVTTLHRNVSVEAAVAWQLDEHKGFVHSFMSSIRFSPITGQDWTKLGLRKDKTLIIAGVRDPIIIAAELKKDAEEFLGVEKVEWKAIDGAHDFPVTNADEVANEIWQFWEGK